MTKHMLLDDREWFRKIEEMGEIFAEVLLEMTKEERDRIKQMQRCQDKTESEREREIKWLGELLTDRYEEKERARKNSPDSVQGPDKQGRQ